MGLKKLILINKKAAMFGLDARIALAVFGTLSVFSGAILFNALDEVDSTALLEEMNQVGKAYSQYYLDYRKELPMIDIINMNAAALVDKNIEHLPNWRGKYLQYEPAKIGSSVININLIHPIYKTRVYYTKAKKSAWASTVCTSASNCGFLCTNKNDCAIWVRFDDVDPEVANAVEEMVDSSKNDLDGDFRMEHYSGKINVYFYVKRTKDIRQGVKIY